MEPAEIDNQLFQDLRSQIEAKDDAIAELRAALEQSRQTIADSQHMLLDLQRKLRALPGSNDADAAE